MIGRRSLLAAAGALASRSGRAAPASVLRFVPQADLAVLDPVWTTAYITSLHATLVFDTLFAPDADGRPQPQMLAGHTVEDDGLAWRLVLRPGLRFHDGTPVLARDVVASLGRWGRRDAYGMALLDATGAMTAASDTEVVVRLRRPFPLLPDALGKSSGSMAVIMPERLARTDPGTRVTEMVGSGPFRFLPDEWRQGDRVAYARFDGYVPRPDGTVSYLAGPRVAGFDRIEWHIIPDQATAAAALQAGEVDWWERPTPDLLPGLRRDPGLATAVLDPGGALQFLRFNHLHPPFDNPAVRRALLGAVSQTDTMTAAGGSDPAMWNDRCGMFTPGSPWASEAGLEVMTSPRDMARVRQDLAAAGYKGERVVFLAVGDVPELTAISLVCADALGRAGLDLDVQTLDWGTVVQRRASTEPVERGGWSVMHSGFAGTDMASPATNLALRGNGRQAWFGWPDIPDLERLRDRWFAGSSTDDQLATCRRMQQVGWDQVPFIPLGVIRRATAYRRDLSGMGRGGVVFTGVHRD